MTHERDGELIAQVRELAFGRANDAVKLIFLEAEQFELLDQLDLRMVSEVKRSASGAVEVKLISRLALLELLGQLQGGAVSAESGAESFFRAMDAAAERLGDAQT